MHPEGVRVAPRVAIVGAGVSGLVAARSLHDVGWDVTVFEAAPDVGGVWSATRAYPGIATQDDRASYVFSDSPMAMGPDEHPGGTEVQAYLAAYVREKGLDERVRLSTRVTRAHLVDDGEWEVEAEGPLGASTDRFDWLVAANGVFSTPHVPAWPGRAAFEAGGGRVLTPGALQDGSVLHGARTVVVGWGKTACDVAFAAVGRSADVHVVARRLMWKYPRRLGLLGLTFRHVILTRAGERLIHGTYRSASGRILLARVPERLPRQVIARALERAIDRATGLTRLGLRPEVGIRASNSLVTEGFFEAVAQGSIRVHRERSVATLGSDAAGPWVELTDGQRLRTDVLVAATGYEQGLGFLSDEVLARGRTADGALLLHRRTLAVDVPRLAVVGWAHSYRSPLTSEIAAAWLACVLNGVVELPPTTSLRQQADRFRLERLDERGGGTAALPGVMMSDLDRMLGEMGVPLPRRLRLAQRWRPVDPADYRAPLSAALRRASAARAAESAAPVGVMTRAAAPSSR